MFRSMKSKTLIFGGAFIGGILIQALLYAENAAPASTPAPAEEQRTVVGEVVDPAAFLKDGRRGVEMTEQTYTAVDGGQTLALLEDGTGNLYLLLAEQSGEDPNELVYDYVNQRVTAKGRIYEKGGLRGFMATSVEPIASTTSAPPAAVKN